MWVGSRGSGFLGKVTRTLIWRGTETHGRPRDAGSRNSLRVGNNKQKIQEIRVGAAGQQLIKT